ncbi:hypothetical protein C0995_016096 [Termitomyces sp. Mi166|nr:hypothetical protein C0995_016096 [Termitomyces sp. Mi166\
MVLFADLDEKEKVQVLLELPPASETPSVWKKTSEGKRKEKEKVPAAEDEEEEEEEEEGFVIPTEFTPESLAQLLPKPMHVVEDKGLEGGETLPAGNKPAITLAS